MEVLNVLFGNPMIELFKLKEQYIEQDKILKLLNEFV